MECPKCEGKKLVSLWWGVMACPHCDGTGQIGEGQYWQCDKPGKPVGKVIPVYDYVAFKLGDESWRLDSPKCPKLLTRMKEIK